MKHTAGWALLMAGIVLLVMGLHSADSIRSSLSRFFTGSPTDKVIWLLLGGVAVSAVGVSLMGGRED